jgi:hypothetical protein
VDLHLVPAGVEQSGLVAAAAEALEAALTGLVAAEAAQRREHAAAQINHIQTSEIDIREK